MSLKGSSKLLGKKFGLLTVMEDTGKRTKSGQIVFRMQCDCGRMNDYEVARDCFDRKKYGTIQCPICREEKFTKGYGEITGRWWNERFLNRCAGHNPSGRSKKKLRYDYNITVEYAWNLFLKQNRKCALSGIALCFPEASIFGGTASLDRIDSNKGYFEDNVQWVHKDVNMLKGPLSQNKFIELCKAVAKFNGACEIVNIGK